MRCCGLRVGGWVGELTRLSFLWREGGWVGGLARWVQEMEERGEGWVRRERRGVER